MGSESLHIVYPQNQLMKSDFLCELQLAAIEFTYIFTFVNNNSVSTEFYNHHSNKVGILSKTNRKQNTMICKSFQPIFNKIYYKDKIIVISKYSLIFNLMSTTFQNCRTHLAINVNHTHFVLFFHVFNILNVSINAKLLLLLFMCIWCKIETHL